MSSSSSAPPSEAPELPLDVPADFGMNSVEDATTTTFERFWPSFSHRSCLSRPVTMACDPFSRKLRTAFARGPHCFTSKKFVYSCQSSESFGLNASLTARVNWQPAPPAISSGEATRLPTMTTAFVLVRAMVIPSYRDVVIVDFGRCAARGGKPAATSALFQEPKRRST